jgi:hypothetical protein
VSAPNASRGAPDQQLALTGWLDRDALTDRLSLSVTTTAIGIPTARLDAATPMIED